MRNSINMVWFGYGASKAAIILKEKQTINFSLFFLTKIGKAHF
jgi:hypothetical protein